MPALTYQLDLSATAIDSSLTDYAARVSTLSVGGTANTAIFAADSGSGADVWFSSDAAGSSPINAKLIYWSDGDSEFAFDVELASVSSSVTTTFYLQVGSKPGGYGTDPYDANTTGVWPMIADFNDFSANGINATANGGLTAGGGATGPDGVLASSAFDGTDDYASVADGTTVDITGALTLEAWVYMGDPRTLDVGVLAKYITGTNNRSYRMAIRPGEEVRCNISGDGTSNSAAETSASAVGVGSWSHVAMVYVPSTSLTIYVDGASAATNTTSIPASLYNSAADFWIGLSVSTDPGDDQFFLGSMANAALHSAARSAAWLKANYLLQGSGAATYWTATDVTQDIAPKAYHLMKLRAA